MKARVPLVLLGVAAGFGLASGGVMASARKDAVWGAAALAACALGLAGFAALLGWPAARRRLPLAMALVILALVLVFHFALDSRRLELVASGFAAGFAGAYLLAFDWLDVDFRDAARKTVRRAGAARSPGALSGPPLDPAAASAPPPDPARLAEALDRARRKARAPVVLLALGFALVAGGSAILDRAGGDGRVLADRNGRRVRRRGGAPRPRRDAPLAGALHGPARPAAAGGARPRPVGRSAVRWPHFRVRARRLRRALRARRIDPDWARLVEEVARRRREAARAAQQAKYEAGKRAWAEKRKAAAERSAARRTDQGK